jgi:peptidoglycan/LPS O-acetylase OafA/YrhL
MAVTLRCSDVIAKGIAANARRVAFYHRTMLNGIQGLRALAALSVATSHSWDSPIRALAWFKGSFLVVDLFFAISGFVVCAAYGRRRLDNDSGFDLVLNRLGRLYPLHLFTLLAFVAILLAKYGAQWLAFHSGLAGGMTPLPEQPSFFDWQYFLLSLTMLQGVGIVDLDLFNFAAWSISTEIWAFTIVVSVFALTPDRRRRSMFVGLIVCVCAGWFLFRWWDPVRHLLDPSSRQEKLLARAILGYCVGVMAWEVRTLFLARLRVGMVSMLQLLLVAVIVWTVCHQPELPYSQLWSLPIWGALLFTLGDDRGWLSEALSTPLLVWLGERSYGIYMAHALVRMGYYHGHKLLTPVDTPLIQLAWLIPYWLGTIALAHWLYTRIEMPVARQVKARIKQRRLRAQQVDAPPIEADLVAAAGALRTAAPAYLARASDGHG